MCVFFSAILTDKKLLYDIMLDNHEDIIDMYGLDDRSMCPNFVRMQFTPNNGDLFNNDMDQWKLNIDQDFIPEWFNSFSARDLMINALLDIKCKHFIVDDGDVIGIDKKRLFIKNAKVTVTNASKVAVHGKSNVTINGSSYIKAYDNSTITCGEDCIVIADDNTIINACGNCTVRCHGKSEVVSTGNSRALIYAGSTISARYRAIGVIVEGNRSKVMIKEVSERAIVINQNTNEIIANTKYSVITHSNNRGNEYV